MTLEEKLRASRERMRELGIPHLYDKKVERLEQPLEPNAPMTLDAREPVRSQS